jgi:hypothetical protein
MAVSIHHGEYSRQGIYSGLCRAGPQTGKQPADDEGGRGLALVDALTERRWGVGSRQGVGKLVWALVG